MQEIADILNQSINAPSGANSQPWFFKIKSNEICIYGKPENDNPALNYRFRGTWVAIGALLENIKITAARYGYSMNYELFLTQSQQDKLVAKVYLEKNLEIEKNLKLFEAIKSRTTNRKPYKSKRLEKQDYSFLNDMQGNYGNVELKVNDKPQSFVKIAGSLSKGDQTVIEDPTLHANFFKEIAWSKNAKTGLQLDTMEMLPPQLFIFKLLRYRPMAKLFTVLGLTKKIASENAKVYSATSLFGALVCPDNDQDFIDVGRYLEHIWLTATACGLSFHLFAGVPFINQGLDTPILKNLNFKHKERIRDAYSSLCTFFESNNEDKIIALIFRVGYGGSPTGISPKMPPQIK